MRKLTLLAVTAMAATALMAATAAPANADKPFEVVHQNGSPCEPCVNAGFEGTITLQTAENTVGCEVSFTNVVNYDGALEVTDVDVSDCSNPSYDFESCDDWPGQLYVPDTGAPRIEITTCLGTVASGPVNHDVTYKVFGPWDQFGVPAGPAPFQIADSYYQDTTPGDAPRLQLL
jgi:hypothetical protein